MWRQGSRGAQHQSGYRILSGPTWRAARFQATGASNQRDAAMQNPSHLPSISSVAHALDGRTPIIQTLIGIQSAGHVPILYSIGLLILPVTVVLASAHFETTTRSTVTEYSGLCSMNPVTRLTPSSQDSIPADHDWRSRSRSLSADRAKGGAAAAHPYHHRFDGIPLLAGGRSQELPALSTC